MQRLKHGHARNTTVGASPTYRSWWAMINRCNNPKQKCYHNYGGRGITVCPEWMQFEAFLRDMGERPGLGYWLDRIDNEEGYRPGNCRWVTPKESQRNKRCNVRLTLNGETMVLTDWAARLGIHPMTIHGRIRAGWSLEDALTAKARQIVPTRGGRELEFRGRSLTVIRWAKELGMTKSSLQARLRLGWSVEQALTTPVRPKAEPFYKLAAPAQQPPSLRSPASP